MTKYSPNNILYRERSVLKVGGKRNNYRASLFLNIHDYITDRVGDEYSIINANLTLTSINKHNRPVISAFMIPMDSAANATISWEKPSESSTILWYEGGGEIEPKAENIILQGKWIGNDISFDITPFVSIWYSYNPQKPLGIILTTSETTNDIVLLHSQQATIPLIGNNQQTNCLFLGEGDTNTINTEGILVQFQTISPYISIELTDTSKEATERWAAFNASISVGNTFSISVPDISTTTNTYTLVDKRTTNNIPQLIVSGNTAGFATTKHTSAEFSCNGKIESGYGIVEFSSPSNTLVTDLMTLKRNDPIIFEYIPTISPNNTSSFTVDFVADERIKNNRVRLFLKQTTVSENRTGLNTSIKRSSIRPRLSLTISKTNS